jgi:hypothetical protein
VTEALNGVGSGLVSVRVGLRPAMISCRVQRPTIQATKAYFVREDGLVFAQFGEAGGPGRGRSVDLASPRSRTVDRETGERGTWQPSWSAVSVFATYDENDDLVDVEVIGVPARRPQTPPRAEPLPE